MGRTLPKQQRWRGCARLMHQETSSGLQGTTLTQPWKALLSATGTVRHQCVVPSGDDQEGDGHHLEITRRAVSGWLARAGLQTNKIFRRRVSGTYQLMADAATAPGSDGELSNTKCGKFINQNFDEVALPVPFVPTNAISVSLSDMVSRELVAASRSVTQNVSVVVGCCACFSFVYLFLFLGDMFSSV